MPRRAVFVVLLAAVFSVAARAKQESWLEVRTPHFTVVCNAGEKQARRIADQFERMRAVFQKRFSNARVDAASPIIVIAVKDKRDFQPLEPESYLAKGQLNLAGLFLQAPDKDYVLLRLDAEGEHPYASIYHEYTHFVLSKAAEWLPLWLNEGLAQFYENTEIRDKEVGLGEPNSNSLAFLRQNRLIPLATLLAIDRNSPYYHEEDKGSVFYAESWALTHYLTLKDWQDKTERLTNYAKLVSNKASPVDAAAQAFGDLKVLEKNLGQYISRGSFYYLKMPGAIEVDDSAFQLQPITSPQADAIRADFLAYNQRTKDAFALLDRVLKDEPNNVGAHETMGYLAFRGGKLDDAEKWYEQAVKLDSQSFLAHYYFASIAMREPPSAEHETQIEASLRAATKLNPSFAPAFDQLAAFYGMQHRNLDEASMLNLTAVQLDPGNIGFRLNRANLMLAMNRPKDAIAVLETAMKLSAKPEEMEALQSQLQTIRQFEDLRESEERANREASQQDSVGAQVSSQTEETPEAQSPNPSDNDRHGPRRSMRGKLRNVKCSYPSTMTLTVDGGTKSVGLRARNYYKVEFSALNFKPAGDLNPCKDLEGMTGKVEYFEGLNSSIEGQIISIELSK